MKLLSWVVILIGVAVVGLAAYVRLAPTAAEDWNKPSGQTVLGHVPAAGAHLYRETVGTQGPARLAELDRIARDTPRTSVLAGSVEEGQITYITRSRIFGFPDFTTVTLEDAGEAQVLEIWARLRFGQSDMGVNRARVEGWLAAAGQG